MIRRRPLRQHSIRGLLVIIAIVAVSIRWVQQRHATFLQMAMKHQQATRYSRLSPTVSYDLAPTMSPYPPSVQAKVRWENEMAEYYRRAAETPWLPLPEDPDLNDLTRRFESQRHEAWVKFYTAGNMVRFDWDIPPEAKRESVD